MTRGYVRLLPENCPGHNLTPTFNGNIWLFRCECGYWQTRDAEDGVIRSQYIRKFECTETTVEGHMEGVTKTTKVTVSFTAVKTDDESKTSDGN